MLPNTAVVQETRPNLGKAGMRTGLPQVWMELLRECRSETFVRSSCDKIVPSATQEWINPLKPELNPIFYLLALLGAHHFLHVSSIMVKLLTLRLLMSYIYIYIYMEHPFLMFLDHTQRRSTVGRTPLDE